MDLNRREFVLLTAAACVGCAGNSATSTFPALVGKPVDLGPASRFSADGVYDHSRDQGVFVVRRGESLKVLPAICTHRACRLDEVSDGTFYCKCHGSKFDSEGHVTEGPAKRDLTPLPVSTNGEGHLLVNAT